MQGFAQLLMDTGLESGAERAVLFALGEWADAQTALVEAGVETLAARAGLNERTVYRALKALTGEDRAGLVSVSVSAKARLGQATVYALDWKRLRPAALAVRIGRRGVMAGASRALLSAGLVGAPASPEALVRVIAAVRAALARESRWADVARVDRLAVKQQAIADAIAQGLWTSAETGPAPYRETIRSPDILSRSPDILSLAHNKEDSPQGDSPSRASPQACARGAATEGLGGGALKLDAWSIGQAVARGRDQRGLWLQLTNLAPVRLWGLAQSRLAIVVAGEAEAAKAGQVFGRALDDWALQALPAVLSTGFVSRAAWDAMAEGAAREGVDFSFKEVG